MESYMLSTAFLGAFVILLFGEIATYLERKAIRSGRKFGEPK